MTDLNPLSMGKGGMIIHSFLKIKEISIQFEISKHKGLTQTLDLLEPSVWLLYTFRKSRFIKYKNINKLIGEKISGRTSAGETLL